LDETRLSFIEKSQTVYDFGLETNRHPPKAFTCLATNDLSIGSLSNKRDAPGHKYFTPMDVQLQRKMKARLSSYQL
jgi:hypothetical protein